MGARPSARCRVTSAVDVNDEQLVERSGANEGVDTCTGVVVTCTGGVVGSGAGTGTTCTYIEGLKGIGAGDEKVGTGSQGIGKPGGGPGGGREPGIWGVPASRKGTGGGLSSSVKTSNSMTGGEGLRREKGNVVSSNTM
jgi:hypothetical protein